jgi:Lipid A 3-O-deacylase (PagL).
MKLNEGLILGGLLFLRITLQAQSPANISIQQYFGSYITSVPKAIYLKDSYSYFTEAAVSWPVSGEYKNINRPQWGIGAIYGNSGSKEYLGSMAAIFPFINFKLFNAGKFKTQFRAAMGPGYIQKPYDINTNHKNVLIGSHLNIFLNLLWLNQFQLTQKASITAGISLSHFSNANTKLPNLGLNVPALSFGMNYKLNTKFKPDTSHSSNDISKNVFYIHTSVGLKQSPWIESNDYAIEFLQTGWKHALKTGDNYSFGIAVFHDPSQQHIYLDTIVTIGNTKHSPWNSGPYIAFEKRIGKFAVPVQLGAYVFYSEVGQLFQNIGIKYYLNRNWAFGGYLLAHWGKADFMHYGIEYIF